MKENVLSQVNTEDNVLFQYFSFILHMSVTLLFNVLKTLKQFDSGFNFSFISLDKSRMFLLVLNILETE